MDKKRVTIILAVIVGIFIIVRWCGGASVSSVDSLYGTYKGTDNNGHKVEIVLKSESDNEWRKYGEDRSDNLVYKDSKGKIHGTEWQSITWTWDLSNGWVKTYHNGNERTIIDVKGKKMYYSWGEYLDKRNGFPYTKH